MTRLLRAAACLSVALAACSPSGPAPAKACNAEQTLCTPATGEPFCANLLLDAAHCGGCDTACATPTGGEVRCNQGQCQTRCGSDQFGAATDNAVCGTKTTDGGTASYCTSLVTDHENCGACGTVCAADQECVNKACVRTGTTACAGSGTAVTYVDLQSSHDNCGACGAACGATEVCRGGTCDPCPVSQCGNTCVDTRTDPKNCGACGTVATACENGAPLAGLRIDYTAPTSLGFTSAAATTAKVTVQVHSAVRVAKVTLKVGAAAPVDMTLVGAPEASPTVWTGNFTVPSAVSSVTIQVDAFDEQYLASRADAAQHTTSAAKVLNILAAPTLAPAAVTAAIGTVPIGTNAGGVVFKWVPLNAGAITATALLPAGSGYAWVEFSTNATNLLLGRQPVTGNAATLTLTPAEYGLGTNVIITACPLDAALQAGPCLSAQGFAIGAIAGAPASPPVIARTPTNGHTIYYIATSKQLLGQEFTSLNTTTSAQPGSFITSSGDLFKLDSLTASPDGLGALAIKDDGTAVVRAECNVNPDGSITPAGCAKTAYVTPATTPFAAFAGVSQSVMLLADTNGDAQFAPNVRTQTTAGALRVGKVQALATGGDAVQATDAGAMAGWFLDGASFSLVLYHPALPGNHAALLVPATAGLTNLDLHVFPGGEIVYQYRDAAGAMKLGAAWFNGAGTPIVLAPQSIGPASTTALAKNFMVAKPGVLLGHVPTTADAAQFQAIELDLNGTPHSFRGTFGGATGGVTSAGEVTARDGSASHFAISDDRTKAIFVTEDPNPTANGPKLYTVHLFDLATGSDARLGTSELLITAGTPRLPRFVHSAPGYTGVAPANLPHQFVVWGEQLPATPGQQVLHERLWFAGYDGAAHAVDRTASYAAPVNAPEVESAAAGQLLFLSETDAGGSTLYSVPLAATGATVTATPVLDRVFWFKVREDKARILVERADGTLWSAALTNGVNLAAALRPIADGGPAGDTPWLVAYQVGAFGFTPDGDHAYLVRDATLEGSGGVYFRGMLGTIDLNTGARVNYGRIAYARSATLDFLTAGFLNNAASAVLVDNYSADSQRARLVTAAAATGTTHVDTGLVAFTTNPTQGSFNFSASLDNSEGLLVGYAGATAAFRTDGSFLSLPQAGEVTYQPAAYATFGVRRRPDYSQLNFKIGGVDASDFKVWGRPSPTAEPFGFVRLSTGSVATPTENSARTADHNELLMSFTNGDGNGYVMGLALAGRAPPPPLTP